MACACADKEGLVGEISYVLLFYKKNLFKKK